MENVKGLVLDLDGVLFDSEPLHRRAWIAAMAGLGHQVSEASLLPWTGIPCRDLAEHYARELLPPLPPQIYVERKAAALALELDRGIACFPMVVELLSQLSGELPVAYATSNTRTDAVALLRAAGIEGFFVGGVALDDVTEPKPSPEPYRKACAIIGVPPELSVAVEDSPAGLSSARLAGLYAIGVTTSFAADRLSADIVVGSPADALRIVMKLAALKYGRKIV